MFMMGPSIEVKVMYFKQEISYAHAFHLKRIIPNAEPCDFIIILFYLILLIYCIAINSKGNHFTNLLNCFSIKKLSHISSKFFSVKVYNISNKETMLNNQINKISGKFHYSIFSCIYMKKRNFIFMTNVTKLNKIFYYI